MSGVPPRCSTRRPRSGTNIFVRWFGSGPPVLRLHGFPETHLMWRGVAPLLARRFTVVCADLRGYGQSGCPGSTPDHAPYTKRAMARDMVAVMEHLGFHRFSVTGHDRGGRVAYRLALDHGDQVERAAVLDIVPTETVWSRADAPFALGYWPWSLLAQPEPLPERLLAAAPDAIVDNALGEWGSSSSAFPAEVRAAYVRALRGPGHPTPSAGPSTGTDLRCRASGRRHRPGRRRGGRRHPPEAVLAAPAARPAVRGNIFGLAVSALPLRTGYRATMPVYQDRFGRVVWYRVEVVRDTSLARASGYHAPMWEVLATGDSASVPSARFWVSQCHRLVARALVWETGISILYARE